MNGLNGMLKEEGIGGEASPEGLHKEGQGTILNTHTPLRYKNILLLCLFAVLGSQLAYILYELAPYIYNLRGEGFSASLSESKDILFFRLLSILLGYWPLFIFLLFFLYLSLRRIDVLQTKVVFSCVAVAMGVTLLSVILRSQIINLILMLPDISYSEVRAFVIPPITLLYILSFFAVFKVLDLLNSSLIKSREHNKMWSVKESKLTLAAFVCVTLFVISEQSLVNQAGEITYYMSLVFGGLFEGIGVRIFLISLFIYVTFVLNTLISYWLTPVSIKRLAFNHTPQVIRSFLTVLLTLLLSTIVAGLLIFILYFIISWMALMFNPVIIVIGMLLVATIFLFIDCLKIFSSNAFIVFSMICLFLLLLLMMAIGNVYFGLRYFSLRDFLYLMFMMIPIAMLSIWVGMGSVQLGIHRLYKKGSDNYDASKQQFYKSWFARIFVPLTRWL